MRSTAEAQLIRRATTGSRDALGQVFERYGQQLLTLIRLRLGPNLRRQVDPRDILQETLLKAFGRIEQFEGSGRTSFMGWLGAIARNEIRNHGKFYRREKRDVTRNVSLDAAREVAAEQFHTEVSRVYLHEQTQILELALDALPESYREVILLRRFEELTFGEISEQMNRSPDACRMLHARAMAALTLKMRELRPREAAR